MTTLENVANEILSLLERRKLKCVKILDNSTENKPKVMTVCSSKSESTFFVENPESCQASQMSRGEVLLLIKIYLKLENETGQYDFRYEWADKKEKAAYYLSIVKDYFGERARSFYRIKDTGIIRLSCSERSVFPSNIIFHLIDGRFYVMDDRLRFINDIDQLNQLYLDDLCNSTKYTLSKLNHYNTAVLDTEYKLEAIQLKSDYITNHLTDILYSVADARDVTTLYVDLIDLNSDALDEQSSATLPQNTDDINAFFEDRRDVEVGLYSKTSTQRHYKNQVRGYLDAYIDLLRDQFIYAGLLPFTGGVVNPMPEEVLERFHKEMVLNLTKKDLKLINRLFFHSPKHPTENHNADCWEDGTRNFYTNLDESDLKKERG